MGLVVVIFHNLWVADWRLIITVFGCLVLIKGVVLIVFPDSIIRATGMFQKNMRWVAIPWAIMILPGTFQFHSCVRRQLLPVEGE